MAHYVGLDVSLEETSICAVDESGNTVWQGKASSEPEAMAKIISHSSITPITSGRPSTPPTQSNQSTAA